MARTHAESATVHLHGRPVGHLWTSRGTHRFELTDEYRETPRRPVLGQIFEENPGNRWQEGNDLPRWFSNLLPEHAKLREVIAEQYDVSPRNEFRLLMPLGSDLPGAVQVLPEDPEQSSGSNPANGVQHRKDPANGPETDNRTSNDHDVPIRFSLAGVQLKLSMMRSANTLTVPGKGELADYLVKLPSGRYSNLVENEYSMMRWAHKTGIDVPDCSILPAESLGRLPRGFRALEGTTVYLIRRFDRGPYGSIRDERIHMEDMNQIVGNKADDKYKHVSYERLGRIILTLCGETDFLEYVRRLTFCIGIGNEDAHLKNWTIWYPDRIRPRLSPAYDLVSIIQYTDLDRGMALLLGGTRNSSTVTLTAMENLAERTDVEPARIRQTVQDTLESMRDSWPQIEEKLPNPSRFTKRLRDYQRSVPLVKPFVI